MTKKTEIKIEHEIDRCPLQEAYFCTIRVDKGGAKSGWERKRPSFLRALKLEFFRGFDDLIRLIEEENS